MQEPGVAEFRKPVIVKNKTPPIMLSSSLHFEARKFKKITDLSKYDRAFPLTLNSSSLRTLEAQARSIWANYQIIETTQ
jgi:hypothetical protein